MQALCLGSSLLCWMLGGSQLTRVGVECVGVSGERRGERARVCQVCWFCGARTDRRHGMASREDASQCSRRGPIRVHDGGEECPGASGKGWRWLFRDRVDTRLAYTGRTGDPSQFLYYFVTPWRCRNYGRMRNEIEPELGKKNPWD